MVKRFRHNRINTIINTVAHYKLTQTTNSKTPITIIKVKNVLHSVKSAPSVEMIPKWQTRQPKEHFHWKKHDRNDLKLKRFNVENGHTAKTGAHFHLKWSLRIVLNHKINAMNSNHQMAFESNHDLCWNSSPNIWNP